MAPRPGTESDDSVSSAVTEVLESPEGARDRGADVEECPDYDERFPPNGSASTTARRRRMPVPNFSSSPWDLTAEEEANLVLLGSGAGGAPSFTATPESSTSLVADVTDPWDDGWGEGYDITAAAPAVIASEDMLLTDAERSAYNAALAAASCCSESGTDAIPGAAGQGSAEGTTSEPHIPNESRSTQCPTVLVAEPHPGCPYSEFTVTLEEFSSGLKTASQDGAGIAWTSSALSHAPEVSPSRSIRMVAMSPPLSSPKGRGGPAPAGRGAPHSLLAGRMPIGSAGTDGLSFPYGAGPLYTFDDSGLMSFGENAHILSLSLSGLRQLAKREMALLLANLRYWPQMALWMSPIEPNTLYRMWRRALIRRLTHISISSVLSTEMQAAQEHRIIAMLAQLQDLEVDLL